ncbi:uncharacterized protein LAESUDRAFT_664130 [Laetiporus sulphureus 93-53]|uniref:Endoplasmic reticulum-based factor for assembly of V-ATPase n=1 Tax=Laetiporus sulphureus 93-53 TaxID=1314785 RepID=A0A165BMR3_9APHY|nr:uncharacterized protein LAESUDRAFT_664130 [Laetiporus sulphureus 93-53]KZT01322.1 hypothetical protein LAESUDRAFT_664130 [Laetiporus sulphureus 93-53]
MSKLDTASELNISLEPHLLEALRKLPPTLIPSLSSQLSAVLNADNSEASASSRTIPYPLLASISSWARSADGERALRENDPPLQPSDYSMVSLLAGTRTSPDRKFPSVQTASTPHEQAQRDLSDRRMVTAVINALLSIGGAGVATWWAAGRLAWKDEWKVLLALFVAIVVATSEAILYMIWDARRTQRLAGRSWTVSNGPAKLKKEEVGQDSQQSKTVASSTGTSTSLNAEKSALRERNAKTAPEALEQ